MPNARQRYAVRELTGYNVGGSPRAPLTTDVYVLDTWYGFAVVWSTTTARQVPVYGGGGRTYDEKLIAARSAAARAQRALEDEHDAWIAA
jgi:hypothetical protein